MIERDMRMEEGWASDPGRLYFWEKHDIEHREAWWNDFCDRYPEIKTVLEVGCGKGENIRYLKDRVEITGIDLNAQALERIPDDVPTIKGSATDMPFEDRSFDLVFTAGVLLHAPPPELPLQMAEIVRCSTRYVFALEYAGDGVRGWRWMGRDEGIWLRDYGGIYQREYGLKLVETGEIDEDSWTGVTWWMLER
jgi:SAM-dependent methyltransferase